MKLDALLCLYRRVKAPAGGNLLQIRRYISPDSSPQANYDYFCATEELLIREALPERYPDEDFNPWGGFQHVRRSMLCTTIARGEGSTASKAAKMIHMINVENGGDKLEAYRAEVRGFLSDQGTERGIASFPIGDSAAIHSTVAAQDLGQANASAMRCVPLFFNALQIPGTLHIIFNCLEFSVKQIPEWQKFERQLSAVTRICKERSWQEVIKFKMMRRASAAEKSHLQLMDQLLDWRWDSLARVLQQWLPLYPILKKYWDPSLFSGDSGSSNAAKTVTETFADDLHYDLAVWAHHFSCEATRLAHFVEGCHCHNDELAQGDKVRCSWKGRRLAFFACGAFEALLRDAMSNSDIAVLGHMLSLNAAAASRIASISDQCNKVFTTVVLLKVQYTQELPWVFCATFAGYMGQPWHRVKEILKKHIQTVDLLIEQGQMTSLDAVTHELFGPTATGRELREFVSSAADTPLHRWPHLFRVAQEYAFVSMSERHTEREHVGVKVAANRGLTKAGPAIVCCRKRQDQVLEMIDDEKELTFLVKHWKARDVLNQLLSHQLSAFEVSRLLPQQRWSRLYGYAEEDHFKDVSDNARAEAIYRQAVRDQAASLVPPVQLPSASFQVVHWLKGHLATGTFFSVSKAIFRRLEGTADEESPAPQNSFPTELLFRALKADVQPVVNDRQTVFLSVLDARPEARADARTRLPVAHAANPALAKRSCLVVQRFHDLEVFDGYAGREARISCSNVRVSVLDLACLCHSEQLQAFCADCLIWHTAPAALSLTLGENLQESSFLSEPAVLKIPDGVLDSDPLSIFLERDQTAEPERDRQLQTLDASLEERSIDAVRLQTYGPASSQTEQETMRELLQRGAIGPEKAVGIQELAHYNAEAINSLQERGIVAVAADMFDDLTLCLTGKLVYSASLVLTSPELLWQRDQTVLTRGQVPSRSKLELIRLLFHLGWRADPGKSEWHCRDGEKLLEQDALACSVPFLRALLLSRLIWQKPGGLDRILLRGPLRYYEYLVGQDDLSSLAGLTAKEIRKRFAVEGKKRTAEDESFPEEQADPEAAQDEAYLAAMPPKAFVVPEPAGVQVGQLPAPQPWQVSLGGGRTDTVYFDNFTHASGQLRSFIPCDVHHSCRLYTFVHHHGSRKRAAAFLLAWKQTGHRFRSAQAHIHNKPSDDTVDDVLLSMSVA